MKPPRPFRDYVAWLRDHDDETAEAYWKQALAGVRSAMPLGLEGRSSPRPRHRAGRVTEQETVALGECDGHVQTLARSQRLTLSTLSREPGLSCSPGTAAVTTFSSVSRYPVGRPTLRALSRWSGCSSTPCPCACA